MSDEEYELFNYVYDMGIGEIASEDILKAGELQKKILTKLKSIDKAIEILQDYDLVENKDKVISDTFKALRGEDNENN